MKTLTPMNVSVPEPEPAERPTPPSRFTYASGTRPLDGYTIKRGVGRGGFGEVYFAVSDAGKEVALKLIRRNLEVELRGVTHCLNLKHPNLVALYDIRTDEYDDRWVVMEYVSGQALDEVIDQHPNGMPTDLLLHWFHGICAGVGYLHDHGIVHRDMKPANLFIDAGTVKIGDYGLSKFISCSRRSGQTESVGTVHYMAPEIANGRYGREIDIYALGIILYEMLTGHVPFEGESVGEVLMKHLTAEPDLSVLAEPYQTIVRRAMAKDPDQRVSSVAEIRKLLPPVPNMPPIAEAAVGDDAARSAAADGDRDGDRCSVDGAACDAVNGTVRSAVADEEPILASLRASWQQAEWRFRNSPMHPLLKALVGFGLIAGLVVSFETWMPLLFSLGFVYLVYRAVRAIVLPPKTKLAGEAAPPHPAAAARAQGVQLRDAAFAKKTNAVARLAGKKETRPRRHRTAWHQQLQQQLAAKPLRDRVTELSGSMLVAAVIASILSILASFLVGNPLDRAVTAWMAIVGTLGSWAVMIPAKLAEGKVEDQSPMRFAGLVLGACLGLAAWGLADALMLQLPVSQSLSVSPTDTVSGEFFRWRNDLLSTAYQQGNVQLLPAKFVAYFAFLFVLLKWWRQAEFVRPARVNLWSLAWCGFVAWGLHFFWWFPQPLGLLLAVVIALSVQLSSPWLPTSRRQALIEQAHAKQGV